MVTEWGWAEIGCSAPTSLFSALPMGSVEEIYWAKEQFCACCLHITQQQKKQIGRHPHKARGTIWDDSDGARPKPHSQTTNSKRSAGVVVCRTTQHPFTCMQNKTLTNQR